MRLKTHGAGAMTNDQGLFRFTTPFVARDSLIVSCMGFDNVLGTVDLIFTDTSAALLHTAYGEARLTLTDRLLVQLGFRENYYAPHRYFYSEPRFFAQWKPGGKGWRVKASYGKYYQFLFQLRSWNSLGVGDASWLIANEFLPAQETWQGTAGLQFDNERLLFSLEVYRKHSLHLTSAFPSIIY